MSLVDAIQIAMEAEQKAAAFYADAARKTANPMGQGLFEQLAEFERYHYRKLDELKKSLQDQSAFIEYEGKKLLPPVHEIQTTQEPNKMSMMSIINVAIETEREAEKRYVALAQQTVDPKGRAMFNKLAKEEHSHYRVLGDVSWNLNNRGTWNWSP